MKTRSPEQSIVGHETQWTQPWPRVRSQVDVIHLVCSTGAIVSNPHLHSVESCPEKSRPINCGGQMHNLMIAIEYSKLDRKNYFNLWCELGRLLLRQSHISPLSLRLFGLKSILLHFRWSTYVLISSYHTYNANCSQRII